MTREEKLQTLRRKLKTLAETGSDPEQDHGTAEDLLLDFIDDEEVRENFESIKKWYA